MATSPPTSQKAAAGSSAPPGGGRCPRCGASHAPDQDYCLGCGIRLPFADGAFARLGVRWRRRMRWYPGDWLWPSLLFLLLAAGGAAAAIAYTSRSEAPQTLVATSPPGQTTTQVASTPATTSVATTTAPAPTTAPPPAPPPPPPRQTKPIAWPAGRSGYTVVLASVPTQRGRQAAVEQARRALAAGLTQVGILVSSNFSSLHPGYYVIFTGISPSESGTAKALAAAQTGGYSGAYVRQVSP